MYFMWIMGFVLLNHRKVFDMYLHIGKDYIIKNKDIVEELQLPKAKIHCSVMAEEAVADAINDYKKKNNLL